MEYVQRAATNTFKDMEQTQMHSETQSNSRGKTAVLLVHMHTSTAPGACLTDNSLSINAVAATLHSK